MHKEIAEKWVEILRSGEYKQTTGKLANVDRTEHCCLGVLCELAIKDDVDVEVSVGVTGGEERTLFGCGWSMPPPSVLRWAGFRAGKGVLRIDKPSISLLAHMNDIEESFNRIADVIEERWEAL